MFSAFKIFGLKFTKRVKHEIKKLDNINQAYKA